MLTSLSIRDVVLIDKLDLNFQAGLSVLTGETGAGKSILLDSLGLALGARAEARLVRKGQSQASVTAAFEIGTAHSIWALLADHGMDAEAETGELIVRRTLSSDGRSKAFINGIPVPVGILKKIGEELVEIHGQFESQRLMSPSTHRDLLDAFGGLDHVVQAVSVDYRHWRQAEKEREKAEDALLESQKDEEYLRHAVEELRLLSPVVGEEEALASKRQVMMHREKLIEALADARKALDKGDGVEGGVRRALRTLERGADKADGHFDEVIATLDRAASEIAEGSALLDRIAGDIGMDSETLEITEERLFALRKVARKHSVDVDGLEALLNAFEDQLRSLELGTKSLDRLIAAEKEARTAFVESAYKLSKSRDRAALDLSQAIAGELEPLRMSGAKFQARIEGLDENDWNAHGCDRVYFEVSTNPGSVPGPINKIASGGELSRLMLALKVVLAQADPVPTLIFDEVDAGIGGATAAAVGERLSRLGFSVQVLVVTHSPQVAARGGCHWHVTKSDMTGGVTTTVSQLSSNDRTREIARMLSGNKVTPEAEAAALSLLRSTAA